jgi:DNA-binding transcriptional MerR regulator/mannose-6-phosphate isomerase-like protein (cupin superfamily)
MTVGGDDVLHTIGEVSRLTGVSAATVRVWEREGLVQPKRTPGRHRLYSDDDVARVRQIAYLRTAEGLNAAAIRLQLAPVRRTDEPDVLPIDPRVGARIRVLRREHRLSQAELATRAGISASFLSAVERGQAGISVRNLQAVAHALDRTLPGLMAQAAPEPRRHVRPIDRPRFVSYRAPNVVGQVMEDLIAERGAMRAQWVEIAPGLEHAEAITHPGEEFVFVVSGELSWWINENEHYLLQANDALYLRSGLEPHRWENRGAETARLLWVWSIPSPETERGRAGERPMPADGLDGAGE